MNPVQQELQIWTGGALNIIELILHSPKFEENLKKNEMSEDLKHFENLKEKKIKIQPH